MRGKILGVDTGTGKAQISGEDNQRYQFTKDEWKSDQTPTVGSTVDFEIDGNNAVNVFKLAGATPFEGDKNKLVAALLAFFLGGLGIHKFYLGYNTAGIIMLCVFIFGFILFAIPSLIIGVIAFIEFIIYLVTPDAEFEEKYVKGDRPWF